MNVILLGSPGVGKGTYASKLSKEFALAWVSTGDIFRDNMKNKTELGLKADEYIKNGELVPDEITIEMTKKELEKCPDGFLLDGFPRTMEQVKSLESLKIDKVLDFVASDETIIQRLSGRRICKSCGAIFHITNIPPKKQGICDKCSGELYQREDDKEEAVKVRLNNYKKQSKPLIDYYKEKGLLVGVDANSPNPEGIINSAIKVLKGK